MQPSLRLGRLAGIEIGIHYTWLLIAVLITGSILPAFIGHVWLNVWVCLRLRERGEAEPRSRAAP